MEYKSGYKSLAKDRPRHLRRDARNGIWAYRRTIPPRLRHAFGGKTALIRSLGTDTERFNSREFRSAYNRAAQEIDRLLEAAENPPAPMALTERDVFGLMRELLLELEMSPELAPGVAAQRQKKLNSAAAAAADRLLTDQTISTYLLNKVIQRLGLPITNEQRDLVVQRFMQEGTPLLVQRSQELQRFNFNSVGGVLEQLPAPPERVTTWETLRKAWVDRRGGQIDQTGTGLSEGTIHRANVHWDEIRSLTQANHPSDVTTQGIREWIQWQRDRGLVPGTIKSNLAIIKAIWAVGLAEGLLAEDVSKNLSVVAGDVDGYQPFTPTEIRTILHYCDDLKVDYQRWLPVLGLYTGARIEELSQLRCEDICEVNDVRIINITHQPLAIYPTKLKGKKGSERQVPIHPYLEELGFWDFAHQRSEGRIFIGNGSSEGTVGGTASRWHRRMLQKLGLYEERKKVYHSWRGCFKDMCRRAGIPNDVHHALTGHSPGNVGDKAYGLTLRKMPETTLKHILKLPNPDQI